jgi:hypothetical protein
MVIAEEPGTIFKNPTGDSPIRNDYRVGKYRFSIICVFRRKPPPDSDSFRHLIPIEVATPFRLIPPWESDPFRHPLERV